MSAPKLKNYCKIDNLIGWMDNPLKLQCIKIKILNLHEYSTNPVERSLQQPQPPINL